VNEVVPLLFLLFLLFFPSCSGKAKKKEKKRGFDVFDFKKMKRSAKRAKGRRTKPHVSSKQSKKLKRRDGGTSSRSGRLFDRPNGRLRVNKRSVNRVRLRRHLDRSLLGSDFIQQVHLIVFRVPVPDFFNHDTHVFLLVYGVFNHSSV
jgi:hypothetical protein